MRAEDSVNLKNDLIKNADLENQLPDATAIPYRYHMDPDASYSEGLDENALLTYRFSKSVKYSAIVAFFMNLLLLIPDESYYVVFALCSLWGYFASLQFKMPLILVYFIYQIANMSVRFGIITYDSVIHLNDDNDQIYAGLKMTWGILLTLGSAYSARFTWKLFSHLRKCTQEERAQLKGIRNANWKALCW
jgi:hypothetical protein